MALSSKGRGREGKGKGREGRGEGGEGMKEERRNDENEIVEKRN
jgi:hypothetical protein